MKKFLYAIYILALMILIACSTNPAKIKSSNQLIFSASDIDLIEIETGSPGRPGSLYNVQEIKDSSQISKLINLVRNQDVQQLTQNKDYNDYYGIYMYSKKALKGQITVIKKDKSLIFMDTRTWVYGQEPQYYLASQAVEFEKLLKALKESKDQGDKVRVPEWLFNVMKSKFQQPELVNKDEITFFQVHIKQNYEPQIIAYLTMDRLNGVFVIFEKQGDEFKEVYEKREPVYGAHVFGGGTSQMVAFTSGHGGTGMQENKYHVIKATPAGYNSELVVVLMSPQAQQYHGSERAKAAIADFKTLFKGTLYYEFQGQEQSEDSSIQSIYRYKLYSQSGREKRVDLISSEGNLFLGPDLFINYSLFAHRRIEKFVHALKMNDVQNLADSLQEDDLFYPLVEAEKVLAKYKTAFDLQTIDYKLTGFNESRNSFIYTVLGTKDGKAIEHNLEMICGDGLTGIRDEWIPSTQEVGTTKGNN